MEIRVVQMFVDDIAPVKCNIASNRPLYTRRDLLALSKLKISREYLEEVFVQPKHFLVVRDLLIFPPGASTPNEQVIIKSVFHLNFVFECLQSKLS